MSLNSPVPEFIDPVFVKTSPKRSFSITENEHFGLVFTKTMSINSGTGGTVFSALTDDGRLLGSGISTEKSLYSDVAQILCNTFRKLDGITPFL